MTIGHVGLASLPSLIFFCTAAWLDVLVLVLHSCRMRSERGRLDDFDERERVVRRVCEWGKIRGTTWRDVEEMRGFVVISHMTLV